MVGLQKQEHVIANSYSSHQRRSNKTPAFGDIQVIINTLSYAVRRQRFFTNPNALVAASKGMRTVKLCTNKTLQFLTGSAG